MSSTTKSRRVLYLAAICILVFGAMSTMSRGGFLGLAVVGLYCWLRSPKKLIAFGLASVLVLLMIPFAPPGYWEEIQSTSGEIEGERPGTGPERLYTWGIGWEMFLANPIMGVGQGNHGWAFEIYQGNRTFNQRSLAGRAAHSLYFTLLPELGLIGFSIFAAMVLYSYGNMRAVEGIWTADVHRSEDREERPHEALQHAFAVSRALKGGMIGYLVTSVFISTLYYPTFWVLLGLVVAVTNLTKAREAETVRGAVSSSPYGAVRSAVGS